MLAFEHLDDKQVQEGKKFSWDFVYLHGKAEQENYDHFMFNGGAYPDLCMSNMQMSEFFPCNGNGCPERAEPHENVVKSIPCTVNGKPAMVVIRNSYERGFEGRVALIEDFEALRHVVNPQEWS